MNLDKWGSSSLSILKAAFTVGFFTILVKAMAMFKDMYIAYVYGLGDQIDAFLIAFLIPTFVFDIIGNSLNVVVVPNYMQEFGLGNKKSNILISNVFTWYIFIYIILSVFIFIFNPLIIKLLAAGFGEEKIQLTVSLLYILIPVILLKGISGIFGAILNSHKNFSLPAVTPFFVPFAVVAIIFFQYEELGIYALAVGTNVGYMISGIVLYMGIKKIGVNLRFQFFGALSKLKQVFSGFVPMLFSTLLMSGTILIDQAMASHLDSGSVSALTYGNKVIAVLLGLSAIALSKSILPHFSQLAIQKKWDELSGVIKNLFKLVFIGSLPIIVVVIIFSEDIIRIVFERGEFSAADTILVSKIQIYYLFQIPFHLISMIITRFFNAINKNQVIFWISGINLVVNIIGNYIFMQYLGVVGIALSTSLVYFLSSLMFYYVMKVRYNYI